MINCLLQKRESHNASSFTLEFGCSLTCCCKFTIKILQKWSTENIAYEPLYNTTRAIPQRAKYHDCLVGGLYMESAQIMITSYMTAISHKWAVFTDKYWGWLDNGCQVCMGDIGEQLKPQQSEEQGQKLLTSLLSPRASIAKDISHAVRSRFLFLKSHFSKNDPRAMSALTDAP